MTATRSDARSTTNSGGFPLVPKVSVITNSPIDDWGEEVKPIPRDEIDSRVAGARSAARRKTEQSAMRLALRTRTKPLAKVSSNLPMLMINLDEEDDESSPVSPGQIDLRIKGEVRVTRQKFNSASPTSDQVRLKPHPESVMDLPAFSSNGDFVFLAGKMNRYGQPAIYLGNDDEIEEINNPLRAFLAMCHRGKSKEMHNWWQARINQMSKLSEFQGLNHSELCKKLTTELESIMASLGINPPSAETIRRYTSPPASMSKKKISHANTPTSVFQQLLKNITASK